MALLRQLQIKEKGPLLQPWEFLSATHRIITLFGQIVSGSDLINPANVSLMSEDIFASLMILAKESSDPITMVVNNVGGSVQAGFSIIQAIEHLQKKGIDIRMLVIEKSASMATAIVASGTIGSRWAMPRSIIHLHETSEVVGGKNKDVKSIRAYNERLTNDLYRLLAQRTRIPEYFNKQAEIERGPTWFENEERRIKDVEEFVNKEIFLSSKQALIAGVIDNILEPGDPMLDKIFSLSHDKEGGK